MTIATSLRRAREPRITRTYRGLSLSEIATTATEELTAAVLTKETRLSLSEIATTATEMLGKLDRRRESRLSLSEIATTAT